jgi:hypothetical protein
MIDDALRQSLRQPDALGRAAPVVNPKPAPAPVAAPAAPVAAAPAKPAEPSFDTMSDDELYRLSAMAKGSDDREVVARGLTAADLVEQRTNKQLGLLQDKKTLEEKTKKAEIDKDFAEKQRVLTEKQQKILDSEQGHFAPSKETAKDIASIFSIMTFATMGAGTVGKYHGMNALASLTGAMKGYKEGRDDLYKKEMDSYNKSLAEFGKHQEALLKQVELSQKLLSTDKDAAMSAAQAAIAMDTGGMAALKLRQGDYKGTMTILRHRLDAIDKAKKDADALAERKREAEKRENFAERRINISLDRQDAKSELMTGADGLLYRVVGNKVEKIEGSMPGMTKLGGSGKTSKGSSTQQQFENITSADIGNAYFRINEYLASSKNGEIPEGSKFLRDKGTQSGIIDAYKNYVANATLPSDLQKNDATLLGIAFDVVAARAFGRASGVTDAKIAQVIRQLPIQGDSEETKQTKIRILLNQLEEPNKLLPEEKRKNGADYMRSPSAKSLYSSHSEQTDIPTVSSKAEYDALPPDALYMEDGKKYRKPK